MECEPVVNDLRKKKFNNLYVNTLKQKVERLENFISQLKNADHYKRDQMLSSFDILNDDGDDEDSLENNGTSKTKIYDIKQDNINKINFMKTNKAEIVIDKIETGQLSVYGKPVIYMPKQIKKISRISTTEFQLFHVPVILSYISNFFRWQYMEYNLYIYRESFLTDFFRDRGDVKESLPYCNEELIFAICACGSLIDFSDKVFMYKGVLYDSSDKFYNRSRYLLFQKFNADNCNSITAIQTFLCLAFYDLSRGRTLSAWILSGIAFRIGLHMGFELNLQKSHEEDLSNDVKLSEYDLNVRSRIYWGCRLADSFISFVLGREPTLEYLNATIPKSENLPILPGIEYFLYYDPVEKDSKISNISRPLEQINELYKIVSKYHAKLYCEFTPINNNNNNVSNLQFHSFHYLQEFNLEVYEWKNNLIEELYWTKTELKSKGYNPNQMSFRYQYYLVLLSVNRDFMDITTDNEDGGTSKDICISVIEEVYYSLTCFNLYHSFKFATLTMVYLCILSITILQKFPDKVKFPIQRNEMIEFFGSVLKECSSSCKLAKSAYNLFFNLCSDDEGDIDINSIINFQSNTVDQQSQLRDFDESLIPSLNYP